MEDKLEQAGLVRILEAIYETDFIDDSYGFRPGRSCHDALRALILEVERGTIHYIVEADIKGFFHNVQHDWMMEFLGHQIADTRVLRYVKRFLGRENQGHGVWATGGTEGQGEGRNPQMFDFLGLTHFCSRTRDGRRFRMKRVTARKKFKAKLRMFKEWLKKSRALPTPELMRIAAAKLRGHISCYGVTDNSEGVHRFAYEVTLLLFKWLNRRGKRGYMNWEKFQKLLAKFPMPRPRIMVNLFGSK